MNLKDLSKEIPCKWRVQSFSKNKAVAICIPYIDAKAVMDVLDRVCGIQGWQSDYKGFDGKLYAGIGIKCGEEWVWKWDAGSESKESPTKGLASDAFKRAGVRWGIGRSLRDMPVQYCDANEKKMDNNYPYVIDAQKKRVRELTPHINEHVLNKKATPKKPASPDTDTKTGETPMTPEEAKETFGDQEIPKTFYEFMMDAKKELKAMTGDDNLYKSELKGVFDVKNLSEVKDDEPAQENIRHHFEATLEDTREANKDGKSK